METSRYDQEPKKSGSSRIADSFRSAAIRLGLTLIELLCVMAIIGILMGIVLPAVQDVREAARNLDCKNKLRQMGMALQMYESANGKLPPGALGDAVTWVANLSDLGGWDSDPNHPHFFKNHQYTSWIVQILPYIGEEIALDQMPRICTSQGSDYVTYRMANPTAPAWLDEMPELQEILRRDMSILFCPSDNLDVEQDQIPRNIVAQPTYVTDPDEFDLLLAKLDGSREFASTNYLGCTGAYSGGDVPNDSMERFGGVMTCRRGIRLAEIRDGQSHTIAVGESLGLIRDRKRENSNSWFFAALARGRSALEWEKPYSTGFPGLRLLGDSWYAYPAGFASRHPAHVNFVRADGSTMSIPREIQWPEFYALCGMRDGEPLHDIY
jgi:prepilin-type N-terminal cleavage/methylation domain-containing protein